MLIIKKTIVAAGLALAGIVLSGCWEEVTEHSPGVYSGASDQLTSGDAAGRTEALQKRFTLVQTDR